MWIGARQLSRALVGDVHAAPLCPSQKEALLRSVTVDGRVCTATLTLKCHSRKLQAAVVSDVLSQSEVAVYLYVIHRGVGRILAYEARRTQVIVPGIFLRPPIAHVALAIELVSF